MFPLDNKPPEQAWRTIIGEGYLSSQSIVAGSGCLTTGFSAFWRYKRIWYLVKFMDFSRIIEELKKASSFDLYRLKAAINQQLGNPDRLSEIKRSLRPGQNISYFDETENRLIEANVIKIMRTRLLVQNVEDQRRWEIPLYYVNLDKI
ncbi:MAG TPA: hypothetical protein ENK33_09030, partial [Desulfobacterales bacterium]|nr:hypothetical protein [Desulfobacterales bacterium]